MANSVYPDQTATLGSGSALFAKACLSMAIRSDWVFHFLQPLRITEFMDCVQNHTLVSG